MPSFNARSYYRRPNRRLYIGPVSPFGSWLYISDKEASSSVEDLLDERKYWAFERTWKQWRRRKWGK